MDKTNVTRHVHRHSARTGCLACLAVMASACSSNPTSDTSLQSDAGASSSGSASSSGGTPSSSGSSSGTAGGSSGSSTGSTSGGSSSSGAGSSSGSGRGSSGGGPDGGSSPTDGGAVQTVGVDGGSGTCGGGAAQSSDVTINVAGFQQRIRGFGCSSAWAGNLNDATNDPDTLWSTTKGAGLTMLRIRYGDGLRVAQAAAQYGVTVWMTPWGTGSNGSPGGPDTTTQTNPNGCKGSMPVLTNGQDLANTLVSWVQNAKSQGVPIYAVSAENEPDSCGINQTTSYSATQLASTPWLATFGEQVRCARSATCRAGSPIDVDCEMISAGTAG